MANLHFISDTHWMQKSIISFLRADGTPLRPFSSVEEMDEVMIENWNRDVKDADHVVHLGDVYSGKREVYFSKIHNRLKGKKSVLLGNHDKGKEMVGLFHSIGSSRRYDAHNFMITHIPIHQASLWNFKKQRQMVNVHGHVHSNSLADPGYVNISVETTNYAPISLDELIERVNKAY